jgi:hypothetical protein
LNHIQHTELDRLLNRSIHNSINWCFNKRGYLRRLHRCGLNWGLNGWLDRWLNRRFDWWLDRWLNRRLNGRLNGRLDWWLNRRLNGRLNRWLSRWFDWRGNRRLSGRRLNGRFQRSQALLACQVMLAKSWPSSTIRWFL